MKRRAGSTGPLRGMARGIPLIALLLLEVSVFSGCGSSDKSDDPNAKTLAFKLTDEGCEPHNATVAAGPVNFEVTNDGSGSVTELEILDGDTILGEKENITEGLSGSFTLTLDGGDFTLRCNGGKAGDGSLKVSGGLDTKSNPMATRAVDRYRGYAERNAEDLTKMTRAFTSAVIAGDVAKAKSLYGAARIPYERIEPVAESFGDLDPAIDARINDVPANQFGGFHRIEQALWVDNSTNGMKPVAEKLLADVATKGGYIGETLFD